MHRRHAPPGFLSAVLTLGCALTLFCVGLRATAQQPARQPDAQPGQQPNSPTQNPPAGQATANPATDAAQENQTPASAQTPQTPQQSTALPESPGMSRRPVQLVTKSPGQLAEEERIRHLPIINGRPYDQPSERDKLHDYMRDSYGLPALGRGTVQALYAEARGRPVGWGTDAAGFGQRYGSALAVQAINGNVRFGFAELFHEDLRYIPCHNCSKKRKIENALLAEITARHGDDGHRFFTLTQTVADFSGPIIAHAAWYPGNAAGPIGGVVAARTVFATRIGSHLFQEFVLERRHHDKPLERD